MELDSNQPQQQLRERALWRSMKPAAPVHINTEVHDNDQMLTWSARSSPSADIARSAYYLVGVQQLRTFLQLIEWKFGDVSEVGTLLDFASGFGRMIRLLAVSMPPSRIWVSDIQADAVAFQQAQFGVHGLVSSAIPEEFRPDGTFDFISVASLFSHLPGELFNRWLARLYSLLSPGGMLCFSVHDEVLMSAGIPMPESGIYYVGGSEIDALDTAVYGTTHVSEEYVRRAIQEVTGASTYLRIKRALAYQQDMYVVEKQASAVAPFRFEYGPWGWIDLAKMTEPGRIYLTGWATTVDPGACIQSIEVRLDGNVVQKCMPSIIRTDVRDHFGANAFGISASDGAQRSQVDYGSEQFEACGWECSFMYDAEKTGQFLEVAAISSTGQLCPLYMGNVEDVLH